MVENNKMKALEEHNIIKGLMKKYKIFIKKYKNPQLKTRSDGWNKTIILNSCYEDESYSDNPKFFHGQLEAQKRKKG